MNKIEFVNGQAPYLNEQNLNQLQDNFEAVSVPSGGTKDQVLAKASNTDNDVAWTSLLPIYEYRVLTGNITIDTDTQEGSARIDLPSGWKAGETKILNISSATNGNYWQLGNAVFGFSAQYSSTGPNNYIQVLAVKLSGSTSISGTSDVNVLVMRMI